MAVTRTKGMKESKTPLLTRKKVTRRRSSRKKKDVSTKAQPALQAPEEDDTTADSIREDSDLLNSSPIKKINRESNNTTPTKDLLSSSPSKKKKSVAFSDDLISDIPSTPDGSQNSGRSILKACNLNLYTGLVDPNNTSLWEKDKTTERQSYGPQNPNFWLQGTIVQLPANSPDLYYLIEGCIKVLDDDLFDKRFEVYATLNSIYKSNTSANVANLFGCAYGEGLAASPSKHAKRSPSSQKVNSPTKKQIENLYAALLSGQIFRDIEETEKALFDAELNKENRSLSRSDPFRLRLINQALRLLSFLMLDQELNKLIPIKIIDWAYRHACTVLTNSKVSKAILSSYLVIIKDCKLGPKRRKVLFDSGDLPEKMLFSLINMKRFPSSSLVSEQFICFKNFVNLFPSIMAKNVHHWFGMLLLNICEIGSPFYLKCFTIGVHCLLEVTKSFLDNRNVMVYVRRFLSSPVPLDTKSMISTDSIELDSQLFSSQGTKVVEVVLAKLQELIHESQFRAAMDIWVALTVLVGNAGSSFDKWEHLNKWLQITKHCFNSQDPDARVLALSCWKAVCFNLCRNDVEEIRKVLDPIMGTQNAKDKQSLINTAMKPKVKLFTYLFHSFNAAEMDDEIINTMHNLFVAILYSAVNPLVIKQRTKYLHILWDKVFQFVFVNFYFKKGSSNARMNQLGLKVLMRLLKPASPINEKNFSEVRCLSNEPVSVTELNSLPSRWIHDKFDRIMQNMILVFQLDHLQVEDKVGFLTAFLAGIKSITRNESSISATTYDIIDNIPIVLNQLFQKNTLSHDLTIKLIVNLHDTFTSSLLIRRANENDENDTNYNLYLPILANCSKTLSKEQSLEVFNLIIQSLSQKKMLIFIADYLKQRNVTAEIRNVFIDIMNKRAVDVSKQELILYGEICQYLDSGFDVFVKRVIQSVVVISDPEDMRNSFEYLNIESWNIAIMAFFLVLVKNAPNKCVHQFTIELLRKVLDTNFVAMLEFLTCQDFDVELLPLLDQVFLTAMEFVDGPLFKVCLILKEYLARKIKEEENHRLADKLLMGCYTDLGIDVAHLVDDDCSKFTEFSTALDERGLCVFDGKIVKKSEVETPEDSQKPVDSVDVQDSQFAIDSTKSAELISMSKSLDFLGTQIVKEEEIKVDESSSEEQAPEEKEEDSQEQEEISAGESDESTRQAEEKEEYVGELTTVADVIPTAELAEESKPETDAPVEEEKENVSEADEEFPSIIQRAFELTQIQRPILSPIEDSPTREPRVVPEESLRILVLQLVGADTSTADATNKKRKAEDEIESLGSPKRSKVNEPEVVLAVIEAADEESAKEVEEIEDDADVTKVIEQNEPEAYDEEKLVQIEPVLTQEDKETTPEVELVETKDAPLTCPTEVAQYSPLQLSEMLDDLSDEQLSSMTNEEKYNMETKLLNLMVRLRGIR
ncbi:Telomere length regulator protein RIF1 [Candida viswanathii]|uniref:Telomere length regulator protein RIF1 n=1 Tax=Candida viswanathii TaxID=5486 RepID=A0A367XS85_9ASCO|nr:Telomere length regulator protein RIF1 [Candida viswanathii]